MDFEQMNEPPFQDYAAFVSAYSEAPNPETLLAWQRRCPPFARDMAEYAAILSQAAEQLRQTDASPDRSARDAALLEPYRRLAGLLLRLASGPADAA